MRPELRAWCGLMLAAVVLLATAGRGPVAPALQAEPRCHVQDGLPDSTCTPGDILTTDADVVCQRGYARSVRNVTEATIEQVIAWYGVERHVPAGRRELDHLVSLEIGGSNAPANLWPQPAPDYHQKDATENWLHARVCDGEMELSDAQEQIRTNWRAVYDEMQQAEGR